jgi:hypothetical protein
MPWNPRDTMNLRLEFVELASHEGANRRELCRRFGISPKTAYKWLALIVPDAKKTAQCGLRGGRTRALFAGQATAERVQCFALVHPVKRTLTRTTAFPLQNAQCRRRQTQVFALKFDATAFEYRAGRLFVAR